MKKMKMFCMTAALLTAFSGTAAVQVNAAGTDEALRHTGGVILNKAPYLTVYSVGEQPDLTGAVVSGSGSVMKGEEALAHWDIHFEQLSTKHPDFSEVDITKPGKYPVWLDVPSTVEGAEPLRIKILELEYVDEKTDYTNLGLSADTLYYELGESLNLNAVKLTTTGRKDGKTWSIREEPLGSHTEYVDASAFDSSKTGEYEITVSVGGQTKTITAIVIEAFEREKGDWDHDQIVSNADAQAILNAYVRSISGVKAAMNSEQKKAADVNGDGSVDVADAQLVLNYYVKNTIAKTPTTWEQLVNPQK